MEISAISGVAWAQGFPGVIYPDYDKYIGEAMLQIEYRHHDKNQIDFRILNSCSTVASRSSNCAIRSSSAFDAGVEAVFTAGNCE